MKVGAAAYAALNIINSIYLNGAINLTSLGIAGSAFALGYIKDEYLRKNRFSKKRHRIVYVKLREE